MVSKSLLQKCMLAIISFIAALLPQIALANTFLAKTVADLQPMLNEAQSNGQDDTIILDAKTWDTSANNNQAFSYVSAAGETFSLTLIGTGPQGTILSGNSQTGILRIDTSGVTGDDSAAGIILKGIGFENGHDNVAGAIRITTKNADISVEECFFKNNQGDQSPGAVLLTSTTGDIRVARSFFKGNNAPADNLNFSGGGGAIQVADNSGSIDFIDNILADNVTGSQGGAASIFLASGTLNMVNNTISQNSGNSGGGIFIQMNHSGAAANVFNNIIFGNDISSALGTGKDIHVEDFIQDSSDPGFNTCLPVNLNNDDFSDFFSACENGQVSPKVVQANNLNQDPKFVSPTVDNFQLDANSPVIDQGDPNAPDLPASDFDGNDRVNGSAPDMGALEFFAPDQGGNGVDPTQGGNGIVNNGGGCSFGSQTRYDAWLGLVLSYLVFVMALKMRGTRRMKTKE